jgi:hypothetical protein
MTWIETHNKLERHPKVIDLMNLMGWNKSEAIGYLIRFWWWCVDYAEDGDLRPHSAQRIATAVDLTGDTADKFVPAMIETGWIDEQPYFRVHDWWSYIRNFLMRKYWRTPRKWRRVRRLYGSSRDTNCETHSESVPNLTIPNHTIPNTCTHADDFEIPQTLLSLPGWSATWEAWQQFRTEVHKPLKPTTIKSQIRFLLKQSDPVAVIEQSIRNGWQGLFPLKNGNTSHHPIRSAITVAEEQAGLRKVLDEMNPNSQADKG